jgi:uncharacterized damage-inducible protein DinB
MATTSAELLLDGFGRVHDAVHEVVDSLSADDLTYRVDPDANTIAWLIWHLTRVQDDHIAEAAGIEQVWTAKGWMERFGLPFKPSEHGYGHSTEEVGQVRVSSPELLTGYYDAVHQQTVDFVAKVTDEDLARIVDKRWDPPVTLGVRLISVISDDLQHAGQAAFVRGVLSRR